MHTIQQGPKKGIRYGAELLILGTTIERQTPHHLTPTVSRLSGDLMRCLPLLRVITDQLADLDHHHFMSTLSNLTRNNGQTRFGKAWGESKRVATVADRPEVVRLMLSLPCTANNRAVSRMLLEYSSNPSRQTTLGSTSIQCTIGRRWSTILLMSRSMMRTSTPP